MEVKSILQLTTFKSSKEIQILEDLGIYSQSDLVEHKAFRYSEILVYYFNQNRIQDLDLSHFLNDTAITEDNKQNILTLSLDKIKTIGTETANELIKINVNSLFDAATYPPFLEAKKNLSDKSDIFSEAPSAPKELMPRAVGSTKAAYRYSSFVKDYDEKWTNTSLVYSDDIDEYDYAADGIREFDKNYDLAAIFKRSHFRLILGYIIGFKQSWLHDGIHLGEVVHSLALAPGESRNITVLDWNKRQIGSISEDTSINEQLENEFLQNRLITETTSAVASEHLTGLTEIESSTKNTSKGRSFGIGGGGSTGGSADVPLGGGAGATVGALFGLAGSFGNSKVTSNNEISGTLITDATGERTVTGELVQNISDSTVQNASNIRSIKSTIVIEDVQSGSQQGQTRNITNYNHSHALTILYYEVLQKYLIDTKAEKPAPVLYLPFNPIEFTRENFEYTIKRFWGIFRESSNLDKFYIGTDSNRQKRRGGHFSKKTKLDTFVNKYTSNKLFFDSNSLLTLQNVEIRFINQFSPKLNIVVYKEKSDIEDLLAKTVNIVVDFVSIFVPIGDTKLKNIDEWADNEYTAQIDLTRTNFLNAKIILEGFSTDWNFTTQKQYSEEVGKDLLDQYSIEIDSNKVLDKIKQKLTEKFNRKDNVKEWIDNNQFLILESSEEFVFTFLFTFEIVDEFGNIQELEVEREISFKVGDIFRENFLEQTPKTVRTISIEPKKELEQNTIDVSMLHDILQHFNENSYYYTKMLIQNMEKEHLLDIVEQLNFIQGSSSYPLREYIDVNPMGMVDNMMIFKLKTPQTKPIITQGYSETKRYIASGNYVSPYSKEEELKSFNNAMLVMREWQDGINRYPIFFITLIDNGTTLYIEVTFGKNSKCKVRIVNRLVVGQQPFELNNLNVFTNEEGTLTIGKTNKIGTQKKFLDITYKSASTRTIPRTVKFCG